MTPFSEQFLFATMIQVLAALDCAQLIKFTHYDLHGNNVLLEQEKSIEKGHVFYLYDCGSDAILVPSFGYRAKIIGSGCVF